MFKQLSTYLLVLFLPTTVAAGPIEFAVGGDTTTASIQGTVDAFRTALGNPNNGNAAGPLAGGRREINWDGGGGVDVSAFSATPFNGFQNTRGALFTTPGTGFFQAPESGGPQGGLAGVFANPTYADIFNTFSALRLFVPVASNITDVGFFIPGSAGLIPATVSGFGAVFTDVDLAGGTRLEYFDSSNSLLGSFDVPVGLVPDGSLSFLGVLFDAGEQIGRVRIFSGTTALGPDDNPAAGVDVVAMDDFLFSEPQPTPEPGSMVLLGTGALVLLGRVRRRRPTANA